MPKTLYKEPKFIQWIRNQYCSFCGMYDKWDGLNAQPVCTPFHIKSRGSGGEDFDNTVPACTKCHILYENNVKKKKSMKFLAEKLTIKYKELFGSQEFWSTVKRLQNDP